jgi:acetoin utilization deacetylase AcuC-like enzyme
MRAFHSARYSLSLPPEHRFPAGKYPALRDRVSDELPEIKLAEAPAASDEDLLRVHTPHYVDSVTEGTLSAAEIREIGFPWSVAMVERARRSVGATIAAAHAALTDGVAANLAGGTHHACADRGGGYCVFNDVAVATRVLQAEPGGASARVVVIDLDVHQGNGTAAIFRDDTSVFTLSLHGEKNFPFRKEASDLDVGLPDRCGDVEYLQALDVAMAQMWERQGGATPTIAFYLAGADPHEDDRLGRLKITADGLAERDRRVLAALCERRIPVAVTMAGGYGQSVDVTVAVHLRTLREALESWRRWNNRGP